MDVKESIREKIEKIIAENPHATPYARVQFYVDYLSKIYKYDDELSKKIDNGEIRANVDDFNERTLRLFETGYGVCQDFTNGLSFLCNMDNIPLRDLSCRIDDGVEKLGDGTNHVVNFLPNGALGDETKGGRFIDMVRLRHEDENDKAENNQKYNCVTFEELAKAYESKDWKLDPVIDDKGGTVSPYFMVNDHWANSRGGNFERLHESIFRATYFRNKKGLSMKEIDDGGMEK